MNPIFYQFKNQNNHLNKLVKLFEEKGWYFDKAQAGYFHEYKWPDIVLSDKKGYLPSFDRSPINDENFSIELLGCYEASDESWNKEGKVVLYIPKIKNVAEQYHHYKFGHTKIYNDDAEKYCNEVLSTVILIHEFVHWIMHWIESPGFVDVSTKHRFIPFIYQSRDEVYFHESLAQIFTKYTIKDAPDLIDVFDWLEKSQPPQYKSYYGISVYENSNNFIEKLISHLTFFREYGLQSFDILKFLLENDLDGMENEDQEYHKQLLDEEEIGVNILLNKKRAGKIFEKLLLCESFNEKESNALIIKKIENLFPELKRKHIGKFGGKKYGI